jgi:hypothetical protein
MIKSMLFRRSMGLRAKAMEIFELTPVILGGSPTDPANKIMLTRDEHVAAVVYWNRLIKELREKGAL